MRSIFKIQNKPLASEELKSYRYKGQFGWVMIGATIVASALQEAQRSVSGPVHVDCLQVWNGHEYVAANLVEFGLRSTEQQFIINF